MTEASTGTRPETRTRVLAVAAATGLLGFAIGAIVVPTWQDVIEPAQVLASIVHYPIDNPVYLYSTRTWTLLHQLPALLLRAGMTERTLAVVLSGVCGLLSFQALGVTILALSEDVMLACVMPFFIFVTHAASGGMAYPVVPVGSIFTSGVIGLSWLLLTIALFGAGEYGAGALLLGILPAVHITLAMWGIVGWLWRFLPSRLMNLPILACLASIIGIAGRLRRDFRSQQVLAAIVLGLGIAALVDPVLAGQVSYVVMLGAAIAVLKIGDHGTDPSSPQISPYRIRKARLAIVGVPIALFVIVLGQASVTFVSRLHSFDDRTTDRVWSRASARPGLLLTASNLHLIQLRTRRAVLLDGGALDALAYVPEAAPATERILRDVYGIDLLAPAVARRAAT